VQGLIVSAQEFKRISECSKLQEFKRIGQLVNSK